MRLIPSFLLVAGLLVSGCDASKPAEYYIGLLNKTGQDLDGVSVYYANTQAGEAGSLVKGGCKTFGLVTLPIPSEAEVRWDVPGERHAVKVKLKDVVPKGFGDHGTVYFVINQDATVDAKPIQFRDTAGAVKLVREARPNDEYRLGFVNKTAHDLAAVTAYYGDQKVGSAGDLPTRAKVGYSDPIVLPIPSEATLRWREDGKDHAVKAELEGVVPRGYAQGTIFFVIKDGDIIEVKPISWSDEESSIQLVK